MSFRRRAITANLAPADVRKAGSTYDLPLAVALLQSSGQIPPVAEGSMFIGQLSLNGDLLHTDGVLPMAALARESGVSRVFVPRPDGQEAALVEGIEAFPVGNLADLIRHISGEGSLKQVIWDGTAQGETQADSAFDISTIRGQEQSKRALEVAAAGSHNLLMSGPPGSGKTLLARTLPTILPSLTHEDAIKVTKILFHRRLAHAG